MCGAPPMVFRAVDRAARKLGTLLSSIKRATGRRVDIVESVSTRHRSKGRRARSTSRTAHEAEQQRRRLAAQIGDHVAENAEQANAMTATWRRWREILAASVGRGWARGTRNGGSSLPPSSKRPLRPAMTSPAPHAIRIRLQRRPPQAHRTLMRSPAAERMPSARRNPTVQHLQHSPKYMRGCFPALLAYSEVT